MQTDMASQSLSNVVPTKSFLAKSCVQALLPAALLSLTLLLLHVETNAVSHYPWHGAGVVSRADWMQTELPRTFVNHLNVSCKICQMPKFCVSRNGTLLMAPSVKEKVIAMAKSRACGLRFYETAPPVRFAANDGSTIDFDDVVEDTAFQPLDILNMENNYAFSEKPIWVSFVNHMPHYCGAVFLNVWRIVTVLADLDQICRSRYRLNDRRYFCEKLNPTLLTLVTARKGLKHWYVGAHAVLQKAYPSVIALDLSAGNNERARYEARECYRSGLVNDCIDRKWAAFRSPAQQRLSQAVPRQENRAAVVIGFLTRETSRSLLRIDETQTHISEHAKKLGVPVTFSTIQFEGQSFETQSEYMANADILIAAHGAGLTNVIFMRSGSVLIEIIPFGYNQHFEDLAKLAGVHYYKIFATPLPGMVLACLITRNLTETGKGWFQEFEHSASKAMALGEEGEVPFVNFGIEAERLRTVYCLRDQNVTIPPQRVSALTSTHLSRLRENVITARE